MASRSSDTEQGKRFLYLETLNLEVTRWCNMTCAHCMRGSRRRQNLDLAQFDKFLNYVSGIGNLNITGGEPSLVPEIIENVVKLLKRRNVNVCNVSLFTNGKIVTDKVLHAYMDLLLLAESVAEQELNIIGLSTDPWHEPIPQENIDRLSLLRAFDQETKHMDMFQRQYHLVNAGRAKSIVVEPVALRDAAPHEDFEVWSYDGISIIQPELITFTVDGKLLNQGDYAYADEKKYLIADTHDRNWPMAVIDFYNAGRQGPIDDDRMTELRRQLATPKKGA